MIKIEGIKYVSEEEAIKAMQEEMKEFSNKGDSEISFIIGLTIMSFMGRLFKGEAKDECE